MHQVKEYRDVEDLKWKVASDPKIIRALASFAHALGFGWCFGTGSTAVGEDFEVRKDGDRYVLQARYDSSDPHADGRWPDYRLRITLSNFQIGLDPRTFVYGTPVIKTLKPVAISTYLARNHSNTDDNVTKTFTYQLVETVTHTTNSSLTQGSKIAVKAEAQVPFGKFEVSTEFSFSATEGWSNSSATTAGQQDTCSYTAKLPAHSQRLIQLIANGVSSDVSYTALAQVAFDIEFYGFLRTKGNAKGDHTSDGSMIKLHFGNDIHSGFEDIWDKWTHRDIPGYWKDWDWGWMEQNFDRFLTPAMRFIGEGIGAPTSGKFNSVRGTRVDATADEPQPITAAAAPIAVAEGGKVAHARTVAAMHKMAHVEARQRAEIADASPLDADEIPRARVIKIE